MTRLMLFILLVVTMMPAFAQTPDYAGKNELSLNGDFDLQAPNGDTIRLQVGYAWFLRDDLLVGGEYLWALSEDIAPGDYRSQQASIAAEKLFPGTGQLIPYVGAEIGFRNTKAGSESESGLVYGVRTGLRYLLTESVSIDTSVRMQLSDKEVFFVDFEPDDQYFYPSIGLKAVF